MGEFFTLTLIAALMIISPGPDFAVVVKNSLMQGRTSGLYAAVGIAAANLCHVAVNLLGIGFIISQSVIAFTVMKILGAAYLIYIGFKGVRAKRVLVKEVVLSTTEAEAPGLAKNQKRGGFYSGFLTSLLNPKACLFFLSFFSVIISRDTPIQTQVMYGVWISIMALLWFWLVAFFFTNPVIAERIKAIKHWIERMTGGLLILLGLKLLTTEISS